MRQNKKQAQQAQQFENVQVSAENFSAIREALKQGKQISVNGKVTLTGFLPSTDKLSDNGKRYRIPLYYLTEDGTKYTAATLRRLFGLI